MAYDLDQAIEAALERVLQRHMDKLRPVEDEFLTPVEAGKVAKVSEDTVRRWVRDGLLRGYGSIRRLRVRKEELLQVQPKATQRSPDSVVDNLLGPRHP